MHTSLDDVIPELSLSMLVTLLGSSSGFTPIKFGCTLTIILRSTYNYTSWPLHNDSGMCVNNLEINQKHSAPHPQPMIKPVMELMITSRLVT